MTEPPRPAYPGEWEADVVLRDGSTCHLRPITPQDADRLREFHARLSPETVYYRFFAPYPVLSERDVARFTQVDHDDRAAIVATIGGDIIGVVRYDRVDGDEAEVAFVIRDDFQGRGLGTVFLEHIAQAARERGVTRFVAEVLPDNARMIEVFRNAGYTPSSAFDEGVIRMHFSIEPTAQSLAVTQAREHRAEALSVRRLLTPSSVAVVGAGRDPANPGHVVLSHLLQGGFPGDVVAVNPHATEIAGVPCYPTLREVPGPVDLAVVVVPAGQVLGVVADAAEKQLLGLVVVSAGFAETGPDGRELQRELVHTARANGMRVIGPNALGVINTDGNVSLNASLSPVMPGRGRIGFFSQSGALGVALLETVVNRGLGLSTFVSAGNRADVSGNDLMQYWEEDRATDVVLLYLESIGNPRKFSRIARRMARSKPVVAVKTGRSTQGIPLGHTVRATKLPPAAVDEMFRQSGVIQTDTLSQMFDVASLLAFQPLPEGRRVVAMGNSDAMAVMAADALAANGLELVGDALTFPAGASADDFERALAGVVDDPAVDSILTMFIPPLTGTGRSVSRAIARVAARARKPIVAVLFAVEGAHDLLRRLSDDGVPTIGSVPTFPSVEDAVRALGAVTEYAEWRSRKPGVVAELPDVDPQAARALVDAFLEQHPTGGSPPGDVLTAMLRAYGITLHPAAPVTDVEAAVEAAHGLGYPVVLKTEVPVLRERSDIGGVKLDIRSESALRSAFAALAQELEPYGVDRFLVQRMAEPGVAAELVTTEDPLFGPVVSFGAVGVASDLLGDRAYRIPPLTDRDAAELVRSPRAAPLLFGYGGHDPVDVDALEDLVVRVSRLADDIPELAELRLKPVIVAPQGLAVLGARARVLPPLARTDVPARRLLG